ncbi:MAG: PCRF domain-containing protein [Phycisphaeraceae bacterium]|nr:MAG: PCRF domain-containing protein [Phycisphaeraceae bacterium]
MSPDPEPLAAGVPPAVLLKLADLDAQHADLSAMLEDPGVLADHKRVRALSIRKAAIEPAARAFRRYKDAADQLSQLRGELARPHDPEFADLARDEARRLEAQAADAVDQAIALLLAADDNQVGSVILEVRAGTGGDEACLWAADLLGIYQKYAAKRGWSFELLDLVPEPGAGGIRGATINVQGQGVWNELAFEAGVHSVKRVPATEAQGRIHTSTATVAVLPEPEDVDVKIDWANDVEEFATRAQGPGGQNVNKVETAWQIHHKPSGIIIKMMEAKSQQQNRERARRLLLTRLHEAERQKAHDQRSAARKSQIRGGERSDKIRTYRWKEGIAADERLPGEYPLREILAGDLSRLMSDLQAQETARRLAEL